MASKRKGRPLLAAAAGVAFVSFASCQQYDKPVGNLRPPEPQPPSAGTGSAPEPSSGGTGGTAPTTEPPIPPVGNLRPPEPVVEPKPVPSTTNTPKPPPNPHPVGNLRPPSDH